MNGLRLLIGVSLAIGLLVTLNELKIPFYIYYPHVAQTILVSSSVDVYLFLVLSVCVPGTLLFGARKLSKSGVIGVLVVWVAGFFMVIFQQSYGALVLYVTVVCIAFLEVVKGEDRRFVVAQLLTCALTILVLIEFSALYYWAGASLTPEGQFGLSAEQLELGLTFSLFPLEMLMMFVLLFAWLWVPMVKYLRGRAHRVVRYEPTNLKWDMRLVVASLDLFMIMAVLLFFFSYLAGQTWIVGVDSLWRYVNPLNLQGGLSPSVAIRTSYTHGLYLVLLYVIVLASGSDAGSVVKFAPLVLAFASGSVVYLVFFRAGWGQWLAILASVCTMLWFPITLGMYAGIQANWLAFIFWMLFLSFYFAARSWNVLIFIAQSLISLGILLLHPWTWGVFFATLVLAAVVSSRSSWRKRSFQAVSASVALALPVGFAAYEFLPGVRYDFANAIQLYNASFIQPSSLLSFAGAMGELFANWSSFLSPALLLICIVGTYALSEHDNSVTKSYLVAWIATWCVGTILIAPSGYNPVNPGISETGIWRMLYVSPLPFLLALGVGKVLDISRRIEENGSGRRFDSFIVLLTCAVLSGILAVSSNVFVRLAVVLVSVIVMVFLGVRLRKFSVGWVLLATFMLLILVNAAFRSLYPLLIDPHNLLGPIGPQSGP